jgi:hypothetical protein
VTVCVAAEFRFTLPNAMLVALAFRVGVPAPSCRANDLVTLAAEALRVTVAPELTDETVAAKLALVAPAAAVTALGTVTAALLLARFTPNPPLEAAALNVTVQLSVPAAVTELLAQLSPDSAGPAPGAAVNV